MSKYVMRPGLAYLTLMSILVSIIIGCASIQTPQGGPRDDKAPEIITMIPKNQTTNFNFKKIIIEFDEYFKIENEVKEFSISPELAVAPTLKVKQKRLEITFTDTLEKNTTYTLNFGKAIADINEGNAIKNLTYVFATGPNLDSLSIKGRVTNTKTGKPELDAILLSYHLIEIHY